MSPKFSLGIALGFTAGVIWKTKPFRAAMLGRPLDKPEPSESLHRRMSAVEGCLDQADRLLLEQARASAAKAFRPAKTTAKAVPAPKIEASEREMERLREELQQTFADHDRALAALRVELEAWRPGVPYETLAERLAAQSRALEELTAEADALRAGLEG